jgi:glycosyltransferase involved in cell wall biosynthesis
MAQMRAPEAARPTVAYVMSRFPKISETFILNEILELERLGVTVEVFPLKREREPTVHREAEPLVRRAHFTRLLSRQVAGAQAAWLAESPGAYAGVWWRVLRGSARSPATLVRALYVVPLAATFARAMRAAGVQHVHAHYATYPALAALVVEQLARIPFSFTAHAHDIYVDRTMLDEKLRAAQAVVTVSEYNRRLLHDLYGPLADGVQVVRCGIDPAFFAPRPPAAPPAPPPAPFTVVSVASLEPYKGHRHLLEACALLARDGLDLRLVLVGDGEERAGLERRAGELGLGERVTFLGRRPRDAVRDVLGGAHAFALASVTTAQGKKEGVPVALMEALATGLPVVATAMSGVGELVADGETGLLVPEGDPAALAAALARLAGDPALAARLGAAGRAKVLEEYDLRRNVRVLRDLIVEPRPPTVRAG